MKFVCESLFFWGESFCCHVISCSRITMRTVNPVTFSLVPSTPSSRREKGLVNLDTILGTGKYDSPTTAIQSAIVCCISLNCRPDSRLISLLQCRRAPTKLAKPRKWSKFTRPFSPFGVGSGHETR